MDSKDLKTRVQEVFGLPIKLGNNCKDLHNAIFEQTGETVSFNTLRRFFGFLYTNSNPSQRTLNTLAKYCGYNHFDDFTKHYQTSTTVFDNFLLNIYRIELRTPEDLNYHLVCRNIAELLFQDLNLLDKHLIFFSTSKVAQVFLFEKFPFIDHLNNPIYKRAIKAYAFTKNTEEAFIYSETLLSLGKYLKNGSIVKVSPKITDKDIFRHHPFLQARILGTFLMADKKEISVLLEKVNQLATLQMKLLEENNRFPFFNYMMADYLILCKQYSAALSLIKSANYERNLDLGKMKEKGYYETFDLLYCSCLYGIGEIELAKVAFNDIDLSTFHFIFKSYFKIRFFNLKKSLFNHLSKQEEDELVTLKNQTQFFALNN